MCPICREPVTFGGGITIENAGRADFASARKYPFDSHHWYQRPSTSFASYVLEMSTLIDSLQFLANDFLRDVGHNVPGDILDNLRRQALDHPVRNEIDVFVTDSACSSFSLRFFFEYRFQSQQIAGLTEGARFGRGRARLC